MTPATLKIDKRYPGVGRIAVRSGTSDRKIYTEIMVSLNWLAARGDVAILRMVQSGDLHPLEVREAFKAGNLQQLPRPADVKPLRGAVITWLKRVELTPRTLEAYRWHMDQLMGKSEPRLADLPKLMRRFRAKCKEKAHHQMWNHARAVALSFVRFTQRAGRNDPLWLEIAALQRLPVTVKEKPEYTPDFCREMAVRLGLNGGMFWAMCITGMNPAEYWGHWRVESDRIRIYGTKRAGRRRVVPLLWVPVKPRLKMRGLQMAMRRAGGASAKSGRDAYAQWMDKAGIPRTRRRMYLGHGAADVHDMYERHELDSYLVADAERLRDYIGEPYQRMAVMK